MQKLALASSTGNGALVLGSPDIRETVYLGHILENKTNLECNQNLLRLFEAACRLTWPVAAR
jgi:hypothetical protein